MRYGHKSQLVARHLALWHQVQLPSRPEPKLFPTLKKWIRASNFFSNNTLNLCSSIYIFPTLYPRSF